MNHLVPNLLMIMKMRGVSRAEAADYLGINVNNFSNWKNGSGKVSVEYLYKMSEYLNVSVDVILGDKIRDSDDLGLISKDERKNFQKNILLNTSAEAGHISAIGEPKADYGKHHVIIPGVDYEAMTIKIEGDSMAPTILHNDYVVGRKLADISEIRQGSIYIVNSRSGVHIKYVQKYEAGLKLIPEAKDFQAEMISYDEVIDVWEVRVRITEDLSRPTVGQVVTELISLSELSRRSKEGGDPSKLKFE